MPAYDWLRRSRTLLYDAYWPPFHPRLAYDPAHGVATAQAMQADAIRFGTIGKWALFPSAHMPHHPELGGRDLLAETVAAAHAAGIRVVGYVPVAHGLPEAVVATKPGWAFVLDDGRAPAPIRHFAAPALVPVCPFGPYREAILAIAREVVDHQVDALYLDGPYYAWIWNGICQCPSCQRLYRAETGEALPSNAEAAADPAGARVARHRDWVAGRLVALVEDLRAVARRRDLPLVFNGCVAEYLRGEWQQRIIAAADGILLESARGGIKGVGRGVHLDKMVWNYTHAHTSFPRLSTVESEEQDELNGRLATAQGAAPIVSYAGRFLLPGSERGPVARLFADLARLAPLAAGSEPVPHAAVISAMDLQPTEGWNKEHRAGHDAHLYAAAGLLRDAGVQQVVLPREALTDPRLARYAAVVLAGVGELRPAEEAALTAWMEAGGTLLASGPLPAAQMRALCGAEPWQPDAATAATLAALRWDQIDATYDQYLAADAASGLPAGRHPFAEPQPVRALAGTSVLAHAVTGEDGTPLLPLLLEHRHGRGRALWFPCAIELAWERGNGVHRGLARLVAAALARGATPPFRLDAPRGVFSNLMEGPAGRLLHLVDEQNDRRDLPCRVALAAPAGARLRDALTGAAIAARREDGFLVCDLSLTRHACLHLEHA